MRGNRDVGIKTAQVAGWRLKRIGAQLKMAIDRGKRWGCAKQEDVRATLPREEGPGAPIMRPLALQAWGSWGACFQSVA